jgi:hypothetical protein
VAWAALILVILEAGALGWGWTHPRAPAGLDDRLASMGDKVTGASSRADAASGAVDGLKGQVASIGSAVQALQGRPEVKPFDPQPLESAVASLRSDLGGLKGAVAAAASAAADAKGAVGDASKAAADAKDAAADAARQAAAAQSTADDDKTALAASAASLSGKIDAVSARLDALSTRLEQEGAQGRQVASLASSAERLARLQAASVALSIGKPVGDVPNAPPSLARFAQKAPPTEASLILAFPDAAAAALKASQPDTAGEGFFRRIWIRAQSAVTVRDGTHVLIGDPAAGVIAAARERLAAGDLDGAVSVLGALSGPAADAMDPWRSQAASLVDARAALASMMARR